MADFFGPKLKAAVDAGQVPMSEIDDHARRVLYGLFVSGVVDDPPQQGAVDVETGMRDRSACRRKQHRPSQESQTPSSPSIPRKVHSIAIIGGAR